MFETQQRQDRNMTGTIQKSRSDATPPPPIETLRQALNQTEIKVDWLAGDGSDRCYYRIFVPALNQRYVLMQLTGSDAENLAQDNYEWLKVGRIMEQARLLVPKPVAILKQHGAIIMEDYGDQMFETTALQHFRANEAGALDKLYSEALDVILQMLSIPRNPQQSWCQRAFDLEKLSWELEFFHRHFLENLLQRPLQGKQREAFQKDVMAISEYLASHSTWFVHRDFHSRNIMVTNTKLGIIDFQDARLGPAAYDIVSLIFDSYIPMPMTTRMALLAEITARGKESLGDKFATEIEATWRPMLLQRQLKALGSFGYLTIVKNRPQYRQCVGPAIRTLDKEMLFD
jgi:aminoglycoside/choline kinase family phosphotransferase